MLHLPIFVDAINLEDPDPYVGYIRVTINLSKRGRALDPNIRREILLSAPRIWNVLRDCVDAPTATIIKLSRRIHGHDRHIIPPGICVVIHTAFKEISITAITPKYPDFCRT